MKSNGGYRLVKLANGVWSVHSMAHRETFHPVIGPVAEAEALYGLTPAEIKLVESASAEASARQWSTAK